MSPHCLALPCLFPASMQPQPLSNKHEIPPSPPAQGRPGAPPAARESGAHPGDDRRRRLREEAARQERRRGQAGRAPRARPRAGEGGPAATARDIPLASRPVRHLALGVASFRGGSHPFPFPPQSTLEGLVTVLSYALQPNRAADFRLCVRQTQRGHNTERSLHLWCLNPAVAFSQLTGKARAASAAAFRLPPLDLPALCSC